MKIFAILYFNLHIVACFASDLNYLQLSALRTQHEKISTSRGYTRLKINSSKRFFNLYNSIQSDDLNEISNAVEDAYIDPYMTTIDAYQLIKYKDIFISIGSYNSLVAEINNPVFPEVDLFNVRSDNFSLSRKVFINEFLVESRMTYSNKWYIDKTISLEEVAKKEVEIELKPGETYTPIHLDIFFLYDIKDNYIEFNTYALDLLNSDKYSYWYSEFIYKKSFLYELNVGMKFSPIYAGDYLYQDTIGILAEYKFQDTFDIQTFLSTIEKELKVSLQFSRFQFDISWLERRRDSIGDQKINNIATQFTLLY